MKSLARKFSIVVINARTNAENYVLKNVTYQSSIVVGLANMNLSWRVLQHLQIVLIHVGQHSYVDTSVQEHVVNANEEGFTNHVKKAAIAP